MSFSVVYLIQRFFYRIWIFIHGWYVGGFRVISRRALDILEQLDRYFAVRINFKNLFQPLYQDQTFLGRILGFIFRSFRIIIGGVLDIFIIIAAVAVYLVWAATPVYIIYWGFL